MSKRARRFLTSAFCSILGFGIPVLAQLHANGTLKNGVYHHNRTGIEFTLPPDWVIVSQGHASSEAQTVLIRDTVTDIIGTVWLTPRTVDPADIPALMSRRLDSKVAQRNNFEGYRYRPDSVQQGTVGGRPGLRAVADYVRAGQQMVEYITWVDGEKSRVAFSARMPASELPAFQSRFDDVIQSAMVP
jgi:hypothetical protein